MKNFLVILIIINLLFFIACTKNNNNDNSNEILYELKERLNKHKIYAVNKQDKDLIEKDKLYLILEFSLGEITIEFYKKKLEFHIGRNPLGFGLSNYKITKKGNTYIIAGDYQFNEEAPVEKIKFEFIFDNNFLTVIQKIDGKKNYINMYYIDVNNNIEERYQNQKKSYLYRLTKDSKDNDLVITKDNKIKYKGELYEFEVAALSNTNFEYYKDKFVVYLYFLFDEDNKFPIEIINNSIKIIKDKKLQEIMPGYYELE